jgi:MFS family permease
MLSILKNPTFFLFFVGNTISLIGFGFNLIGFSWLVLEETGSEILLGQIMAAATLPGLLISLFTGVIIDKMNRKWLLVILDIFRMIIIGGFVLLLKYEIFSISILFCTVFLMGIGNSLFWPTATAFVQELVSEKEYFNANALLSASYQFGSMLGAGLGGLVVHFYGVETALSINSVTYLISAIFIVFAPFIHEKDNDDTEKIFNAVSKGFLFLRKEKGLLIFGLTSILADVAIWGSLTILTISMSKFIFNSGSWGYGVMDGSYGAGALISTFISGYIIKRMKKQYYLLFCFITAGLMCIIAPSVPTLWLAAGSYFIMGLCNNSARITTRTVFMEMVSNKIMGRVQTILGMYTRVMVIASSLTAGYLIEKYSIIVGMTFSMAHFFAAAIGIFIIIRSHEFRKVLLPQETRIK